jgi:hypothetical protein
MARPPTRVWHRRRPACPDWCTKDHRCTAKSGDPTAQHRSRELVRRTRYGSLVATRTHVVGGSPRVEVRLIVDLPRDDDAAARQRAIETLVAIDQAVRRVRGEPVEPLPALDW